MDVGGAVPTSAQVKANQLEEGKTDVLHPKLHSSEKGHSYREDTKDKVSTLI